MTNEEIIYDIFRRVLAGLVVNTGQYQGMVDDATHITKVALDRLKEFGIVKPAEDITPPKDETSLIREIIQAVYGIEISQTLAERFITQKDHFFRNRNMYLFTQDGVDLLKLYAGLTGQKGFERTMN
jgi:hypothetical protein